MLDGMLDNQFLHSFAAAVGDVAIESKRWIDAEHAGSRIEFD